jgi:HlyD family secretion protein
MKRKRLARVFIAAGVVAVAWAGAARGQIGGPAAVYLEPAERRAVRQTVELAGTVEARRRSVLGAEVAGRVEKMLADEGDYVKAGDPVCQMRRLPVELELKQAEGQLVAARADLKKMEQGYRPEEVREAEARKAAAQAGLEKWELEYARTKRLLAEGASTAAEMESVEASYRQAGESLAEAQANLDLVKSGYRAEDVEQSRGRATAQEATVEHLRDALAKMTIAMPYDGFIVRKHTEAGEWLQAGQPVVEIVDLSVVRLLLDVPERYAGDLEKGLATPVVFESLADREFVGKVSQIVPASAAGTHTIPVRVDIENPIEDGRPVIAAGLFGRAWLPVGKEHSALLVPKAAVIRQIGQDYVYTVTDVPPPAVKKMMEEAAKAASGKPAEAPPPVPMPPIRYAVAIPVEIVQGYGRFMEVKSEKLEDGTRVVTRGTYLLSAGALVQEYPKEQAEAPIVSEKASGASGAAGENR